MLLKCILPFSLGNTCLLFRSSYRNSFHSTLAIRKSKNAGQNKIKRTEKLSKVTAPPSIKSLTVGQEKVTDSPKIVKFGQKNTSDININVGYVNAQDTLLTKTDTEMKRAKESIVVKFSNKKVIIKDLLAAVENRFGKIQEATLFAQKNPFLLIHLKKDEIDPELSRIYNSDSFKTTRANTEYSKYNKVRTNKETDLKILNKCQNVSDQIWHLYEALKVDPFVTKLQYFLLNLLSQSVNQLNQGKGLYGTVPCVIPFGSAACGLAAKNHSDLDMTTWASKKELHVIYSHIKHKLPHIFSDVIFIKRAKVPVVSFNDNLLHGSCDIVYENATGLKMTQSLFTLHRLDKKFYPLVFTIKYWAQKQGLIDIRFKNFHLTVFLLAYLQQRNVLPDLNSIISKKDSAPYITLKPYKHVQVVENSLEDLLLGFFKFYGNSDLINGIIDICEGTIKCSNATDNHSFSGINSNLYIRNPFQDNHNMANMSRQKLTLFRLACLMSFEALSVTKSAENWGITSILEHLEIKKKIPSSVGRSEVKLMKDILTIFDDPEEDSVFEFGDDINIEGNEK